MITGRRARDAPFRNPLPEGFSRRVFRVSPGDELRVEAARLTDTLVLVEQGQLELECRHGTCLRFGPGSMIPIALLPVSHVRSVGVGLLVLVAVSRASLEARVELHAGASAR